MNKKDYQLLATHLSSLRDDVYKNHAISFDRFVSHLCIDLKRDNENFDPVKFRAKVYDK